ncbi:MAG TPA: MmcQ/YjbR family DNA-binding protein [Verrucomicrobiota bacterium]|nr:hypothetical protein [Verrucomicrobiales bacterium]HRI14582.1 MmcQ/YjbR family DNA-binding protein [Verrucomicrobiota bacterium]
MTIEQFRKLALALSGAVEAAHQNHPDFRVGGRIFASLGYPDAQHGMVKLTPEWQQKFVDQWPDTFQPCRGAWGRQGCTSVRLARVPSEVMKTALESAFAHAGTSPKARNAKRRKVANSKS